MGDREAGVKYAEHNLQIKSCPSFIFFVNTGQNKTCSIASLVGGGQRKLSGHTE